MSDDMAQIAQQPSLIQRGSGSGTGITGGPDGRTGLTSGPKTITSRWQGDPDWVAPQDPRDWAYYDHDVNLNNAGYIEDPQERQAAREAADLQLSKELEAVAASGTAMNLETLDLRSGSSGISDQTTTLKSTSVHPPPVLRASRSIVSPVTRTTSLPTTPTTSSAPPATAPRDSSRRRALGYTIEFSNEKTAEVPADNVVVTEQLSPNLDWSTFQLGTIGFGSYVVNVPPGLTSYSTRVDATATLGVYVDIDASLNLSTGLLTVTFTSLDPTTLDTPSNPLVGFLPPDTDPPNGEGYINYTIQPKAGPGHRHDAGRPGEHRLRHQCRRSPRRRSSTRSTPARRRAPSPRSPRPRPRPASPSPGPAPTAPARASPATTSMSPTTAAPFTLWQSDTTATSATYTGQIGHTYGFYSVATDNVGLVQPTPTSAQATTQIVSAAVATTTSLQSSEDPSIFGDSVTFPATVSPARVYQRHAHGLGPVLDRRRGGRESRPARR